MHQVDLSSDKSTLLFGQIIRLAKGGRNHANLSSWLHETTPLPYWLWAKAGGEARRSVGLDKLLGFWYKFRQQLTNRSLTIWRNKMSKTKNPKQRQGAVKEFEPTFDGKPVKLFEQETAGTFRQLFSAVRKMTEQKLNNLVLIRFDPKSNLSKKDQVLDKFKIKENKDILKVGGNLFLCKEGRNFFVAYVFRADSGRLDVLVYHFADDSVWDAGSRPRLVVAAGS